MNPPLPTKVLFVITKSNWGGAQVYVYKMAKAAKARGFDVAVAFGGSGLPGAGTGLLAERLKTAGIRTIFLSSFARDVSVFRELRAFWELYKIVRAEKPDVLHLNSSKAGGIGAAAGRLAGVKTIIFSVHGWAHKESRGPAARALIWIASYATGFFATHLIVLSEEEKRNAPGSARFAHKIVVVRNGIDSSEHLLTKAEARAGLSDMGLVLPIGLPVIMTIGELTKNKSHETLIAALKNVKRNFFCILIGDGELRSTLEAQVASAHLADKVIFAGFVPDAARLLSAADIFVLPSLKEGLPLVLLEAGRAGLATIASKVGGIPEIITDEKSGLLVAAQDVTGLTNAIETLLADASQRERFGAALKSNVATNFSESQMFERTFALY